MFHTGGKTWESWNELFKPVLIDNQTIIEDGRAMSDLLQGVTLEVMGEGNSMGPIADSLKEWAESLLQSAVEMLVEEAEAAAE